MECITFTTLHEAICSANFSVHQIPNFSGHIFIFPWPGEICAKKKHFKEKLLNKTVSSSKILHNFFFHIKWVIRARNGLPPPVPTIQFGCVTAAFPATADTAVLFAVTAEDGRISIFPHPFSTLVLCLQFPLCCMIISSTPLCLTITIPSFSLSFPFLLFLFTWVHLHSITGFLS